jgi:hypothetical protein
LIRSFPVQSHAGWSFTPLYGRIGTDGSQQGINMTVFLYYSRSCPVKQAVDPKKRLRQEIIPAGRENVQERTGFQTDSSMGQSARNDNGIPRIQNHVFFLHSIPEGAGQYIAELGVGMAVGRACGAGFKRNFHSHQRTVESEDPPPGSAPEINGFGFLMMPDNAFHQIILLVDYPIPGLYPG